MKLAIALIVQLAINMTLLIWCEDTSKEIDKLTDRIVILEDINRIEYL
jgi:hypothetical protein